MQRSTALVATGTVLTDAAAQRTEPQPCHALLMQRRYAEVDVFTAAPYRGNPLAVVVDGDGLPSDEMQRFANWTNLSETTFLLPPRTNDADYRVRIFTPYGELPFAGHPTLGSCSVWLDSGGSPRADSTVVQECGAGLITLRLDGDRPAFAAPPMIRTGDVEDETIAQLARALRLPVDEIVATQWIDNGPGWVGVLLADAATALSVRPDGAAIGSLKIGLASPHPAGSEFAIEVRAFFPTGSGVAEDPVTGSLNASLAQWLCGTGRLTPPYVARQGTALGRDGRIHVSTTTDAGGEHTFWIAGDVATCVSGNVEL